MRFSLSSFRPHPPPTTRPNVTRLVNRLLSVRARNAAKRRSYLGSKSPTYHIHVVSERERERGLHTIRTSPSMLLDRCTDVQFVWSRTRFFLWSPSSPTPSTQTPRTLSQLQYNIALSSPNFLVTATQPQYCQRVQHTLHYPSSILGIPLLLTHLTTHR